MGDGDFAQVKDSVIPYHYFPEEGGADMPWHKVHTGGKWKVVKDDGGKVVGTHDTEEDANKQLAALYANEKPHRALGDLEFHDLALDPAYTPPWPGAGITAVDGQPVSRVHRDKSRRER